MSAAALVLEVLPRPAQAAPAAAPVVLPDPVAEPEQAELAGAVSLLVRSYLNPGERNPILPRRELAMALEAMTGSPPASLAVSEEQAPKLIERLACDGLVFWRLNAANKGITVTGNLFGRNGRPKLRISVAAANGDVSGLARQLARKLAPVIGASLAEMPDLGLGEVRPLVAAEAAMATGDAVAVSRAADLVLPPTLARLPAAKQVMRQIAEDATFPALARAQARLLRGESAAAAELADAGLAKEPKNALLRAVRIRALAESTDFAAADKELALLKRSRNSTALALAQLSLALARGESQRQKDRALAPLLGRPAGEWLQVLPLIAGTPPGTFGLQVEAEALAAAAKLQSQDPGLATLLATRALAGGAGGAATASLIHVRELSAEQIKALSIRLNAEADAASVAGLSQQIKAREDEAKELAEQANFERPTGPPSDLALNLQPVLQEFDALYSPALTSIQIAPLPGSGQPIYWPFLVRKQNLAEGLLESLRRSPWDLRATRANMDTEILPSERFSDEAITTLAHDLGASALMLYRIRPAGLAPWVKVDLILYDSANQQTEHVEASLVGRSTGLVMISPLMVALGIAALLAALSWAVVISFRGAIQVRVQWDSDAKDELFSIQISKTQKTPTVENMTAYRKKLEWLGRRKRRFEAWNIEQNTTFRGIPRGKWYVHLYGIYTRGRKTMQLHEPPQEAIVSPRRTTFVAHVLEAAEAEFKIKVIDDAGPVEGARVWIDKDKSKPTVTGKDGCITFKVAKGYRVIHVIAHGMTVEKAYQVVKAKLHEFTINLVWERRQEYVSRALERQVDDVEQYMPRPSATGTHQAVPASVSAMMRAAPAPGGPPPDSEIVDLAPAPTPASPPAGMAIPGQPPATARSMAGLKPLAPLAAQAALAATQVPSSPATGAAVTGESPLDLDMSGAVLGSAPGVPPKGKPPGG